MPPQYQMFVAVQGVLGRRFGEAVALRRRSIDVLHRRLRVTESVAEVSGRVSFGSTKSHAHRAVPMPSSLVDRLGQHLDEKVHAAPDALVFTSPLGYVVRHSRFRSGTWLPALRTLGLPLVGAHALRHSAAARMIAAGWSATAVQQALGHASAAFTLTVYGHLFDADLDALGEALDRTPRDSRAVQAADSRWR